MFKSIATLYLTIFAIYVLFSRQPDYFDGETAPATIHFVKDSATQKLKPEAFFTVGTSAYHVDAAYFLRSVKEGEKHEVIYELANPKKAALYKLWGYWITAGELAFSIIGFIVLFQVAVGINKNPTPEALMEQLSYKPERKRRYDD